jgi:hypothetical protein
MLTRQRPASALVFTPDGRQIEHVVLAADELTIGREPGAAHVVDRLLPVASLRLSWRVDGLHAVADGGVLFVNDGQDHDAADAPISSPAELSLYADGPERVDHALLGTGGPDAARLQLTPWPPQGGRP